MKKRALTVSVLVTTLAISLGGCSEDSSGDGQSGGGDEKQTVNWWTWDDQQAVSYAKCEAAFEDAHPDINVEISQYGWGDYWTKITAGFVGGTAPDAFQNHPNYYPEFADQGQLLPLNDYLAADDFTMDRFDVGLSTWGEYKDGNTYGLPKDWSTLAFWYNEQAIVDAGLTDEDLQAMTWNPQDGGTFQEVIARLSIDENGVRGDEPGFDPKHVKVYGMSTLTGGGINGQDSWAQFAPTTGWTLGDKENWPTTFQYSDSRYVDTANWIRSMVDAGYMPGFGQFSTGIAEQLGSESVAMVQGGSWYLNTFKDLKNITVKTAPSVVGPEGKRAAMSGSNADSIWAGSKNTDAAWKWISFMGSEDCQTLAGADGTFLPSIKASMDATEKTLAENGSDLSAFTIHLKDGTLYEAPLYNGGNEMQSTISPMSEAFWNGERDDDVFAEMDQASVDILSTNN